MPRKDKTFSAFDIVRFMCRNITIAEREFVLLAIEDGLECESRGDDSALIRIIIDYLLSGKAEKIIGALPGGNYANVMIKFIDDVVTAKNDVEKLEARAREIILALEPLIDSINRVSPIPWYSGIGVIAPL